MSDNKKEYKSLEDLLGDLPDQFSILEEHVDISLQTEFFEMNKDSKEKTKEELDKSWESRESLYDEEVDLASKKEIIVDLVNLKDVQAFRFIEKCRKDFKETKVSEELKQWLAIAHSVSAVALRSELLDEEQVFISSGMGGKNNKLRNMLVLIREDVEDFDEVQIKVLKSEFPYFVEKHGFEIEQMDVEEYIFRAVILVPMKANVKSVIKGAILECNQFGNFVHENYLITNVKMLSFEEIRNFLESDPK